ncbi:imidazolonepropionase [Candidatus Bipolaricaulota bacterium]|nr:imidazolonepropionase [Candidatus Bipolaricaulota bacterium]HHR84872.1 imidazolonepropionase [Candidatus Acetothermia bacterium]
MNTIISNISQLVTARGDNLVRGSLMSSLSVQEGVSIRSEDGIIVQIGRNVDQHAIDLTIDAHEAVVLPGLVDPHTHAVFAETREEEFLARLQGQPYGEGGIQSSARAVAAASEKELVQAALPRLRLMLESGTTTVEIKSGYGLSLEGETKLLLAIRQLRKAASMRVVPTFLGAHAFPQGVRRDDYISTIITEMIPTVRRRRLAQFCDVFCDEGFFTPSETRTILRAARGAGLRLKLHADELADVGGAELAADLEATSADHLLRTNEHGMRRLQEAGVIPVLLPGTAFTLGSPYAPARRMVDLDLPVALATDFNPGTCLIYSMWIIIALAVMRMSLTIEEALTAATLNAAAALELSSEIGSIEEGKHADLLLLDLDNYRQIPYFFGYNPVRMVLRDGQVVYNSPGHGKPEHPKKAASQLS